ncbi:MAG: hypothetical protein ABIG42_09440 [bacterium]
MRTLLYLLIALMIFGFSCSKGGNSPLVPNGNVSSEHGSIDSLPIIGVSEFGEDGFSASGMLGAYNILIDPSTSSVEILPMRTPAIGEDYIVSGKAFFTIAPCPTCLKIKGIALDLDGNAIVTFSVDHPFKPGDPGLPPTAVNRLDLDVFDLAMVIRPLGATPVSFTQTSATAYAGSCVDPDGFTTELADIFTPSDQAAMPYFLCVDDSIDASPPVSTWNEFPMGGSTTFDVGFDLSSGIIEFESYLTMGYGFSATKQYRLIPKYYNPEFNRKAAWKVDVIPPEGANPPQMGNTWNDAGIGDPYDVTVHVFDWQIGATVYSDPLDFENAPENNVFAASEPSKVTVEIPGMSTVLPEATAPDNPSSTGMPNDPWIYTIPVSNDNLIGVGEYTGLVKVTDSRPTLSFSEGRDYLIDTVNGINLTFHDLPEYATYQTFTATVVVSCGPITGSITSPPSCPVTGVSDGQTLNFVVSASSDNGGTVVLYEVDYDYDNITFNPSDSNTDGIFTGVGPFTNPNCPADPVPMVPYTVAFRATDDCSTPNETIFATCEVQVDSCVPVIPIISIDFDPKTSGDTYFDVCVRPNGRVYIAADHPATGNTGIYRTAIRYNNDLTAKTVMNSGFGINIYQDIPFTRIDVSDGGTIINNPGTSVAPEKYYVADWIDPGGPNFSYRSGYMTYGYCGYVGPPQDPYNKPLPDLWNVNDNGTYGANALSYEEMQNNGCTIVEAFVLPDSYSPDYLYEGGFFPAPIYDHDSIAGIDGFDGSGDAVFLISSATEGYISRSGNWLVISNWESGGTTGQCSELATFGSLGTGDGQFTGGLDVVADSNGNVVTLEDLGTSYRFQKFSWGGSSFSWVYSSTWDDDGDPLRMDFDRGDNELYLISTTGLHIMSVQ